MRQETWEVHMLRTTRTAALAAVLLSPFVASAPAGPRPLAVVQAAPSYTYLGTVHGINTRAGWLDLITGVGMALRMVHMTTQPTTLFAAAGGAIRLGDLKPGDLVRAECRSTAAGMVASRIERIEVPTP
jgi:hypothetical protein